MKKVVVLFFWSIFSFAHISFTTSKILVEEDRWETGLSPLNDLIDILNFIYHDAYRQEHIQNIPAGYPLLKKIDINSFYGVRKHPVHQVLKFHRGIDLKADTGEITIATGDGIVMETGFKTDIGNYIKIQHKYGFETIYGHLSKINVKKGEKVLKNQKLGLVGATGTVTGPHLHFTIKKNGEYIDPFDFIFMEFTENQ